MNILITGALGHIGSKLITKLKKIKKLNKVYFIDCAKSNNLNVLFGLRYKKISIKFIYGDLINKKTLNQINDKIDVIIHLASTTNVEQSFKNKKEIYSNNYGIFKKILEFSIKKRSRLIHLSSTSVYGPQKSIVDETSNNLNPKSPYADVKLLEEKLLKKNNKKLKFVTFRFGTITGFSQGMRFHTAANKFCLNAILKRPLTIWNNAMDLYRPYLSLDDAIKTIIFFINKKNFNNEIYNVLTANYTVRQILQLIKNNGIKIKIKQTRSPILNQTSYFVSRKKIEKLKINLSSGVDKDIRETLTAIKSFY